MFDTSVDDVIDNNLKPFFVVADSMQADLFERRN